ncbi:putative G-protein-coupled receptor family protein [Monocercomonoides exilis]|uniref:putative G-protein-coupled receptor family protein n=1 Tax=Monocercomonoides exilis TaxID=2049356 RepID=UPI0035594410|nr:putative G-protein-coupled receptor family protein [Monocercomonoides exilis]|eukprot:MONOS_4014.1-p1 / transcript=MONOS_4014.1 / gene=MONOS_4014 / organism=Monocercomonoides_exilis_PA203 / gene_product=mucolipin / transcript_product=mucolipin / location=Mono_scaffold00101:51457-53727(+) / protein_length=710 / sequence_SO=supercontig / SO=protein_coding / is_pseudo=false
MEQQRSRWLQYKEGSLEDKITLSPIEKWKRYRIFPSKLVIQCVTSLFVVAQFFLPNFTSDREVTSNIAQLSGFFLPEDYDHYDRKEQTYIFYSKDAFLNHLKHISSSFFEFQKIVIGGYVLELDDSPPISTYTHFNSWPTDGSIPPFSTRTSIKQFTLTKETPFGPFGGTEEEILYNVRRMKKYEISFFLSELRHNWAHGVSECVWEARVEYSFEKRGIISVGVNYVRRMTRLAAGEFIRIGIDVCLMILAIWSIVLVLRSFIQSFFIMLEVKKTYNEHYAKGEFVIPWSALPVSQKMRFFNGWDGLTLISSFSSFTGALIEILSLTGGTVGSSSFGNIFRGIGALLVFMNYLRFLDFSKQYSMSIRVCGNAMPVFFNIVISSLPFYLGFILVGCAVYSSRCEWYAGVVQTALTLWGLMNGDSVLDIWNRMFTVSPFFSFFFLFTFVMLFIYVIVNLFYSIIEEAYFLTKQRLYSDWEYKEASGVSDAKWDSLLLALNQNAKKKDRIAQEAYRREEAIRRRERKERILAKMKQIPGNVQVEEFTRGRKKRNTPEMKVFESKKMSSSEDATDVNAIPLVPVKFSNSNILAESQNENQRNQNSSDSFSFEANKRSPPQDSVYRPSRPTSLPAHSISSAQNVNENMRNLNTLHNYSASSDSSSHESLHSKIVSPYPNSSINSVDSDISIIGSSSSALSDNDFDFFMKSSNHRN